jgi:HPt (histidine-containing phosphotransfer) domain-containing protein
MDGYVTKPIHRGTLYAEIARVAKQARGIPAAPAPTEPVRNETAAGRTARPTSRQTGSTSANDAPADRAPTIPAAATTAEADAESSLSLSPPLSADDLLRRCEGDRPFAARLLDKFRRRLPDDVRELEQAAAAGDGESVRRLAHRLKGCAGNVGATAIRQRAGLLEAADLSAAGSSDSDLAALRQDVAACLDAVEKLIRDYGRE